METSVIIPAYNASERLYYNLIALNNQDYPSDKFEVVVVNNGSRDNTMEMLSRFQSNYKLSIINLDKNKGIAYARNQGILKAKGKLLIFHDSDMIATRDFISDHIKAHQDTHTVVCGNCWKRVYSYYYKRFRGYQVDNFQHLKYKYNLINEVLHNKDKYPLLSKEQIMNGSFIDFSFDLDVPFILSLKQELMKYGEDLKGYHFPWRFFITNNCSVYKQNVINTGLFDAKIIRYGFEDYDLGIRLYKMGCRFLVKEHILSIHQEHPINYKRDDTWYNLYYMCTKYHSPYFIDMFLAFSTMYTSIDPNKMNEIMDNIYQVEQMEEYKHLIYIFFTLLTTLCKRQCKKYIKVVAKDNDENLGIDIDFLKIKQEGNQLYVLGFSYFVDALYMLIKDLYNIDMAYIGI
ncbi:glycosyltransferase family 2 protein [Clostridiaceae bacterium 35-E11]